MSMTVLLAATLRGYAAWFIVFAVLTIVERVWAREPQSLAGRLRALPFWLLAIPVTVLCLNGLYAAWDYLGVEPLFTIGAGGVSGPLGTVLAIGAALLGAAIGDF